MKRFYLFLVFFSLCGCSNGNPAKESFELLQKEYENTNLSSNENIAYLIEKIDTHISQFEDFSENSVLIDIKASLEKKLEANIFALLEEEFTSCFASSFQGYEEASEKLNKTKNSLQAFMQNANDRTLAEQAKEYIERLDNSLSSINQEKMDYYTVISSNSPEDMEQFIIAYPNTVMREGLLAKIDETYMSKLMTDLSMSHQSIDGLNKNIADARTCMNKLRSLEAKAQLAETLSNLEGQRRQILDLELADKMQDLIKMMGNKASNTASSEHPTYEVTTCVARGNNPEVVGTSSIVERIYEVRMKGRFLGYDERLLAVQVTGRIEGNINTGVFVTVTGAHIISDEKTKSF
ncbi:hypothetical protein CLI75_05565 [Porphyromonas gingivalis]|uniref:Lipoprotein n=1 Tax=Porphyromonas gingivalis TaxID=837 RepID=A0AAE9X8U7_PORGN|nr:hypothetical protein [Porphyromonas gingivalis]PDP58155.1 hypothetical protein CLI75_05565 [Porphyromonas gingivalis]RZQ69813.1 hypothetical protein EW638_01055 [Porphyromonas gingivalis]WCF98513.1 hypothetical protein NY149_08365 [Porphyromonas gingivalis]